MEGKKRRAADEAIRYLTRRMRTAAEVRRHLKSKGYSDDDATKTIEDLIELKYIDDYRYAVTYCEYGFGRMRGSMRVKRELAERGIDDETIERACLDYLLESGVDEEENAYLSAQKLIDGRCEAEIDDKVMAAAARRLKTLGYRSDTIIRVLRRIRTCASESEFQPYEDGGKSVFSDTELLGD